MIERSWIELGEAGAPGKTPQCSKKRVLIAALNHVEGVIRIPESYYCALLT